MIKDYLETISSTMKVPNRKLDVWILLLVFLGSLLVLGIHSLKNVQVIVPNAAKIHDTVSLQCKYDLEQQPLYTVKWYKGVHEIFRYIPQEELNMGIFDIPGVKVDLSRSSSNEIVLLDVQSEATGKYSCEVLTDEPYFYTSTSSGFMYVVDIPQEAPIMEIENHNNNTETIKAKCTTPPSFPAMNVSWYINGIKVNESGRRSVSLDPYSKNRQTRLMTISLMHKDIDNNIFQGGIIKVQCLSTLFNLYKSEDVRYIEDNRAPWPSSVIESIKNSTGSSSLLSIWACVAAVLSIIGSR